MTLVDVRQRTEAVYRGWPSEAVQAHLNLEASNSIGMHFGTFQLTTEGIDEPICALGQACEERSIPLSQFRTLASCESVAL